MHGTAIVVVNGVTAKQIDQKSVEFRHSDPGSTFSRNLFMERNNDVSLSHHFKYLNHRFLWFGIISGPGTRRLRRYWRDQCSSGSRGDGSAAMDDRADTARPAHWFGRLIHHLSR